MSACSPFLLTDSIAVYLQGRFRELLNVGNPPDSREGGGSTKVLPNINIPTPVVCEVDRLADIMVQAFSNQVLVEDFNPPEEAGKVLKKTYAAQQGIDKHGVNSKEKSYNKLNVPAILVTQGGEILAWYLPSGISDVNQDQLWKSLMPLDEPLTQSITRDKLWRTDADNFRPGAQLRGCLDLSPAWYPQGHNARTSKLRPSQLLRPQHKYHPTAIAWLKRTGQMNALTSAALSVMHPNLYSAARKVAQRLWDDAQGGDELDIEGSMSHWPSVYNVLSIMVNRRSPYHADANGKPEWMDMLISVGNYGKAEMILPGIGMKFQYLPGTMVLFSGRLLLHGVAEADGDRACLAWYMRRAVHQSANVQDCGYAKVADIV